MKKTLLLISTACVLHSSGAFAALNPDEEEPIRPPPVIVEGTPDREGGGSGPGFVFPEAPVGRDQVPEPVEIALQLIQKSDIRCNPLAGSLINTTSQSDLGTRQLAAQTVFRSLNLGERRAAVQGGFLRLTYADGGTEDWTMPMPSLSDGGINQPIPNTLKVPAEGAGVPKESKVCAKVT